ncbi:MAG: replicative DNA helicase [Absicoccus porci]|jgi:replicative DNA helicase|uniref:Replicative DNA helicase n=2 Tax=Absicoccus porci TaxID=2486576 RepID=A0A3N0HZJ2_9FIRM|nr:replicative DNA helicase [Absicoccus porci]MCI6087215.1 replicative DNA helicase [Absicoccus porci]MDD6459986.1 replicative DNA helicase [Absicoccus porci]MDD7329900.1 replicative DNA helicase [Absicoccus porci]MDY4737826.1 replicative DNA helicase [Absicoccus porci]MEE1355917.1 replicative DNA helicase [Absicoccus porci]
MARELPNSQPLECALLGAMMMWPEVITMCLDADLEAEEFYLPAHQRLYQTIMDLQEEGKPVDQITVMTRLQDQDKLASAGGADYIVSLVDTAIGPSIVPSYVEEIKNKAQLRRLIQTSDEITNLAYTDSSDIDAVLDQAERSIMDVTRVRRGAEFESSREISNRVIAELNELRNHQGVTGIKTGFTDLDAITNGFQRGDLIILAARPAMGKSALALNFLNQVAKRNPGCVAMFSLEMPSDSLMKRLLSCESRVFADKLRSGHLSESDMSKLNAAASHLSEREIYIDDTSSIRVSQIFSKCRKLKSEHGQLSLIVIDYLQLITGGRQESRQQEVSDISRNLKILAKEMECPVIALSQLSRKVEERTDHEPQLSDLRESGSIEQDADIVMFLYRENYYEKDKEEESDTEVVDLSLAKHRNGAIGKIHLAFEKSLSRFTNYANQGDDIYAH